MKGNTMYKFLIAAALAAVSFASYAGNVTDIDKVDDGKINFQTTKGPISVLGNIVIAKYTTQGGANDPIGNSFSQTIDYNIKLIDTHGAVTVGTGTDNDDNGWVFTAPVSGYYDVKAQLLLDLFGGWVDVETFELYVHINNAPSNNTIARTMGLTANQFNIAEGNTVIYLNKGDTSHIEAFQNSGSTINVSNITDYNVVIYKLVRHR